MRWHPLHWLANRPGGSLLALAVATALLSWAGRDLQPHYEVEDFFPRHTAEWTTYQNYQKSFGRDDRTALMLLESPQPVALAEMSAIDALTRRLEAWPEAERVVSPGSVLVPRRTAEGNVSLERAFKPGSPDRLTDSLGKLSKPPFVNSVLSADRRLAVVALTIREKNLGSADRTRIVRALEREKAAVESGGRFQVQLAGYPVHRVYLAEQVAMENLRLLPWALAVVVVMLAVIFRSWVGVVAPLAGAVLAVLWTRGLMALTGLEPNIFAPALFLLVGLMAVSHAVHLLSRHRKKIGAGLTPGSTAREVLLEKAGPCGITSLTTALVFAGLSLTGIPLVANFGLAVGLGSLSAWLVTMLLLPPMLARMRGPAEVRPAGTADPWQSWGGWVRGHSGVLLAGFAALALVFAIGATRVRVNSPLLADLDADHPVRQANDLLDKQLGGVIPLDVLIPSPAGPSIAAYTPERMGRVEALAADLRELPGVLFVSSPTDMLRQLHPLLENVPAGDALMLMPTALLLAPEQVRHWVDDRHHLMRLRVRMANIDTADAMTLFDTIREKYAARIGPGNQPVLTGQGYLGQRVNHQLVAHFQRSFWVGLVLVALVLAVALRSLRLAMIGLLPNLFPLIVVAGVMGFAGIELRYTSALVLTVVFGLAVDDTIHVLSEMRAQRGLPDPMGAALASTGAGVLWTSGVLAGGFSVLLASSFFPHQVLGGLLALAAVAAVMADLALLPALAHFPGLGRPLQPVDFKRRKNDSPTRRKNLPVIAK
jgi:predicted RND superfamily exporter protein